MNIYNEIDIYKNDESDENDENDELYEPEYETDTSGDETD